MAPRSAARSRASASSAQAAQPAALTDADVRTLQQQLSAGEKPKVALLRESAIGPAGTPGVVVSVTEPAVGECVIVRVRGDDLPFAADELSWPVRRPRGRPRKEAASSAPASTSAARTVTPQPGPSRPPAPSSAPAAPAPVAPVPAAPAPVAPVTPEPAPRAERTPEPAGASRSTEAATPTAAPKKTAARRRPGAGAPPPFSVSLRFTGKGWTSESSRGGKRSKPQPVSLAAMRALATRLDDVELRNTILASLDHCRRQVEERAASLRAELEQAEIALAELEEDA